MGGKNSGRRPNAPGSQKQLISARVDPSIRAEIQEMSNASGLNRTRIIENLLRVALGTHEVYQSKGEV